MTNRSCIESTRHSASERAPYSDASVECIQERVLSRPSVHHFKDRTPGLLRGRFMACQCLTPHPQFYLSFCFVGAQCRPWSSRLKCDKLHGDQVKLTHAQASICTTVHQPEYDSGGQSTPQGDRVKFRETFKADGVGSSVYHPWAISKQEKRHFKK